MCISGAYDDDHADDDEDDDGCDDDHVWSLRCKLEEAFKNHYFFINHLIERLWIGPGAASSENFMTSEFKTS